MSQLRKRNNSTEKTAKNVDEAVEAALKELGVTKNEVTIEVIDEGAKGFLGIGARDASVRVTVNGNAQTDDAANVWAKTQATVAPKPTTAKKENTSVAAQAPADIASKFLKDVFAAMKLDVEINAKDGEDNTVSVDISGENMGIVIGKRGDTLDSLQYLTSLVVNKRSNIDGYIKVSLDTENYREKREEALLSLSKRLAEKVIRTGKKFTLEPMNPYERRIIHSSLQDNEEVTTFSVGTEPYRKVVIAPKNYKPSPKKKTNTGFKKRSNDHHYAEKSEQTTVVEASDNAKTDVKAENVGSYTTTYKADFKPTQHKAEYKTFDDYLAAHNSK